LLLTLCALLACPAGALAQSSETGYENVPGVPVPPGTVPAPPPPPDRTTPAPSRPAPAATMPTTTTGPTAVVLGRGGKPPTAPGPGAVPVASPPARTAQLPFTGLDLGLVALAGVALLMAGVVIRRVTGTHLDT
jgi:hypothetical protein